MFVGRKWPTVSDAKTSGRRDPSVSCAFPAGNRGDGRACAGGQTHVVRPDAPPVPGLVLSKTSDTRENSSCFSITSDDAALTRLRRSARHVLTSARLMQESLQRGGVRYQAALVTLTFRDVADLSPRAISGFLAACREYLRRRGFPFRYVWVLELGSLSFRPHYHVVVWLPRGLTLPMPDKRGWWPYGASNIKRARRPVGYLAAYCAKGVGAAVARRYCAAVPAGARICGSGGLGFVDRLKRAWWMAPGYIRDAWSSADRMRRAVGGGWVSLRSGEWMPSPYLVYFEDGLIIVRLRPG